MASFKTKNVGGDGRAGGGKFTAQSTKVAASPRPAPIGPRQLEAKAVAADENIHDAARTNKQADTNTTNVARPATKTAGPSFDQEIPWTPPEPNNGTGGMFGGAPSGKPYKLR